MAKTVGDYEDAVRRIANSEVDPNSTTLAEVRSDLHGANTPQLTPEVAEGVADAIVTEERVLAEIEASGELPTEGEVGALTAASDDYDLADRVDAVSEGVSGRVATVEEVSAAVREREAQSVGPTFREEVETAVNEVASRQEFVGASPGEVSSEQAREIGAPRETDFRRTATQTVAQAEQVSPADVVEGTQAKTPVQLIEDTSGEVVAATGGPSAEMGEQVASELGAEYMSTEEVVESMNTEGTGEQVNVTLRGRTVGEVSVE